MLRHHALAHPAFEIGLGRGPQVQIRIELAAKAFNVEQSLLQQYQLRLHFHIEAPRGLEQAHQQLTEGNVLERSLEDRFAHTADRGLEFVDPRLRRNPARVDVQLGNAAVVALEEGQQVARKIVLIVRRQAADDAEVHCDVLRLPGVAARDENVARMHVGVEKSVAEYLGKEDLDARFGQLLHVCALVEQGFHVGHRQAADPLHDHHLVAAQVPVHLGDVQQRRVFEIAPQLRSVGGFTVQVQLVEDGLLVIADHFHGAQAACLAGYALQQPGGEEQPLHVLMDDRTKPRARDLDYHLTAILQARHMHLCHRSRCQGLIGEAGEHVFDPLAELFFDALARLVRWEGRNTILKMRQFYCYVISQ